jgi:uncharacterized protein YqgC (DUF456 family)
VTLAAVLAGVAVAVGVVGTLLPFLPGLWLVAFAMVAYGLATGFGPVGIVALTVALAALIAGTYLGIRIPQRAAAGEGLRPVDQIAGLGAAILGFFVIPVVGLPIGFVVGVWLVRWARVRSAAAAWRSARRTLAATIKGSLAQFASALVMAACFAVWVWLG